MKSVLVDLKHFNLSFGPKRIWRQHCVILLSASSCLSRSCSSCVTKGTLWDFECAPLPTEDGSAVSEQKHEQTASCMVNRNNFHRILFREKYILIQYMVLNILSIQHNRNGKKTTSSDSIVVSFKITCTFMYQPEGGSKNPSMSFIKNVTLWVLSTLPSHKIQFIYPLLWKLKMLASSSCTFWNKNYSSICRK